MRKLKIRLRTEFLTVSYHTLGFTTCTAHIKETLIRKLWCYRVCKHMHLLLNFQVAYRRLAPDGGRSHFNHKKMMKRRRKRSVSGSGSTICFTNSRNVDPIVTVRAGIAPVTLSYTGPVRLPIQTSWCRWFDSCDGAAPRCRQGWTRRGQPVCQGELASMIR